MFTFDGWTRHARPPDPEMRNRPAANGIDGTA